LRLFVAIEMPRQLGVQLAERVERVRGELPRVRWLDPTALHLTLVFLGAVAPAAFAALDAELAAAFAGVARFRLQPAGGGAFPPGPRPRVLWVGFERSAGLEAVQRRVAAAAGRALGEGGERRSFHAHVTLARCQRALGGGAAASWRAAFPAAELTAFEVAAGALIESRLEPDGARYRRRAEYPLEVAA